MAILYDTTGDSIYVPPEERPPAPDIPPPSGNFGPGDEMRDERIRYGQFNPDIDLGYRPPPGPGAAPPPEGPQRDQRDYAGGYGWTPKPQWYGGSQESFTQSLIGGGIAPDPFLYPAEFRAYVRNKEAMGAPMAGVGGEFLSPEGQRMNFVSGGTNIYSREAGGYVPLPPGGNIPPEEYYRQAYNRRMFPYNPRQDPYYQAEYAASRGGGYPQIGGVPPPSGTTRGSYGPYSRSTNLGYQPAPPATRQVTTPARAVSPQEIQQLLRDDIRFAALIDSEAQQYRQETGNPNAKLPVDRATQLYQQYMARR